MGLLLSWAAGEALEGCLTMKYQRPRGKQLESGWQRIGWLSNAIGTWCYPLCPSTLILPLSFKVAVDILVSLLYPG